MIIHEWRFAPSTLCIHFIISLINMISFIVRMMSNYAVETINDGINEFNVEFHSPKESMLYTPLFALTKVATTIEY